MNSELILSKMDKQPITYRQLARLCNIPFDKNKEFSNLLFKMMRENLIAKTEDSQYFKLIFIDSGEGKFKGNPKGFGFVDIEGEDQKKSIFFSPITRNDAVDGDKIAYKVFVDPVRKREVGIVTKILARRHKIVGILEQHGQYLDLIPFNQNIGKRIKILNKRMTRKDHVVVAKIIRMERGYLFVEITKDLGHKDDEHVDIEGLIISSGVNYEFPEEVIQESKSIPNEVLEKEIANRKDLRNLLTITIDGADSKDFDDAISVENKNNNYLLYVHIADVSHYVTPTSEIDKEALSRGTSIYVPGRVIPMLPEKLSNGICSLNPNLDRLSITCEMEVDTNGEVVKTKVYPTVINSNKRMIYHDVNMFLKSKAEISDPRLSKLLTIGYELSKILSIKNQANGYIDFEIEEAKIILNKKGRAEKIEIHKQDLSEKMIENFMVLANEQVALFIENKGLPFMYRTHGKPKNDKIQNLKNVITSLGINANVKNQPSSKEFSNFVQQIKETRFDNFIKIMLLRTMAKAVYAKNNIGHFGLALSSYTHFTSPIRRYPDLMVHRMLRTYIFENNLEARKEFESTLQKIATANSESEVIATDLERQVVDFKKTELYEKYVGLIREGLIVSINRFGMFVEFEDKVDGLVRLDSMQGFWKISEDSLKITSNGKSYEIGQKVRAKIVGANKFEHKIDLVIMDNHY